MEELQRIIPNSEVRVRKGFDLKKIIPQATEKGFTALVVVNEDRKLPSIFFGINVNVNIRTCTLYL